MSETSRYRKKPTNKGGAGERGSVGGGPQVLEVRETPMETPMATPFDGPPLPLDPELDPSPPAPPPPPGYPVLPTSPDSAPGILGLRPTSPSSFPPAPSGPALVAKSGRTVARLSERGVGGVAPTSESSGGSRQGMGGGRQSANGDSLPPVGKVKGPQVNRTGGSPTAVVEPLPRPPMYDFTPDPAGFFKYWATCPPERCLIYVYRNWPVWDPMLLLSQEERGKVQRKELRVVSNIAKLNQPWDPKHWEAEVLHRWGSGDYHIKLNDLASSRAVAMVTIRGLRDFDNYPPVLDRRAVVMTDPANSSYIERMRLKGTKFPGDSGAEEEEEEMSGAMDTVKDLAATVTSMAAKMADQNRVAQAAPQQAQVPAGDRAAVEVVAEGARQGISFLTDAMKTMQQSQAAAQDPRAYLADVMGAAKAMAGANPPPVATVPNPGEPTVIGMMQLMMAAQERSNAVVMEGLKDRLAFAERMAADANTRMLESLQRAAQPQPQAQAQGQNPGGGPVVNGGGGGAGGRPPSMIDELYKLLRLKERLDELGGGGGGGGNTPGWVPYALQGLNILATAGTNIAYNIAAARGATGAVPPPPMPSMQDPGGMGQEEEEEEPQPQQIGAGGEGGGQGGAQTEMNPIQFAQRLHGPLVKALNDGVPGYQFAAQLILHEGAMVYHYMAGQGKDRLLGLMQQYPPLWADVIRYGASVEVFLDEFMDREQALATAEEMRVASMTGAPPPPMPSPKRREAPGGPGRPQGAAQGVAQGAQGTTRTVMGPDGRKVEVIIPPGPTGPTPPAPRTQVRSGGGGPKVNASPQPAPVEAPPPPAVEG